MLKQSYLVIDTILGILEKNIQNCFIIIQTLLSDKVCYAIYHPLKKFQYLYYKFAKLLNFLVSKMRSMLCIAIESISCDVCNYVCWLRCH